MDNYEMMLKTLSNKQLLRCAIGYIKDIIKNNDGNIKDASVEWEIVKDIAGELEKR